MGASFARFLPGLLSCLVLPVAAAVAQPGPRNIQCGRVESGNIHIDGLLSDWEGVEQVDLKVTPQPGAPPSAGRPLGAHVRCNYDDQAIYLLIEVEDDIVARTRAAGLGEDHIELGFATGAKVDRLLIWPSVYAQRLPRQARWSSGRTVRLIDGEGPAGRVRPLRGPPAMEAYDALQQAGYAVELRLPRKLLPGYREGASLPLGIRVVDSDSRASPRPVAVAESSPMDRPDQLSRVLFEEGESNLSALLRDVHLGPDDISWEQHGNLGSGPGRVLLVGPYLAVVGKEYFYQQVAPQRGDLGGSAQLVGLGNGSQAVAVRTIEHGQGGQRQVLTVYRLQGGRFQTIFAAEVAKQQGQNQLSTQVSFVKRGRSTDIVLVPQPPVGFTADSYQEVPADDVLPILLPWRDRRTRYVWKGAAYVKAN